MRMSGLYMMWFASQRYKCCCLAMQRSPCSLITFNEAWKVLLLVKSLRCLHCTPCCDDCEQFGMWCHGSLQSRESVDYSWVWDRHAVSQPLCVISRCEVPTLDRSLATGSIEDVWVAWCVVLHPSKDFESFLCVSTDQLVLLMKTSRNWSVREECVKAIANTKSSPVQQRIASAQNLLAMIASWMREAVKDGQIGFLGYLLQAIGRFPLTATNLRFNDLHEAVLHTQSCKYYPPRHQFLITF